MKKNKIFSLIFIIPILAFSLIGCSPVEIIKTIDTISNSFNSISKLLNEGDVYSNNTSLNLRQTFHENDNTTSILDTNGKYFSKITIGKQDDDENTNISIQYSNSSYISLDSPTEDYDNPDFINLYDKSQAIDFSKLKVTGKIDLDGIFHDNENFDSINCNSDFFSHTLNYLSCVGIDDVVAVDDTWDFDQVFISPSGKSLNYEFKMKCYKIDDEQFYVKGTAKAKSNKYNITSTCKIDAAISIEDAFISNYKFTLDTSDVNPKNPNQKVDTSVHIVSRTSNDKRVDE